MPRLTLRQMGQLTPLFGEGRLIKYQYGQYGHRHGDPGHDSQKHQQSLSVAQKLTPPGLIVLDRNRICVPAE